MSKYITTVIKTGNSYALRVPKQYIEDGNLRLGQKVSIPLPGSAEAQNRTRIQSLIQQLQALHAYQDIPDPVAWQKAQRTNRPLPGRS